MSHTLTKSKKHAPHTQRVRFELPAPEAAHVAVAGSFCNWDPQAHVMQRDPRGTWSTRVPLLPGTYEYRFVVDGDWRDDPACRERVPNSFGTENCVLHVAREDVQALRTAPECAERV